MSWLDLKLKKTSAIFSKVASRELKESQFIPYVCHYDENTILTKSGDLLQTIKIDGLAFETADPAWLNFQKELRNTLFRSIAKSDYAIYVHTIRRKQNIYPEGEFLENFAKSLNETWKEKNADLELYVNDFYLTIVQKPQASGIAGLKGKILSLIHKSKPDETHLALKLAHKELTAVSSRFLTNLKPYGARLLSTVYKNRASYSEPAQFFSHLINLESRPMLVPDMGLGQYLANKRLLFGKEALEIRGMRKSKIAAMISVKEYCDASYAGILDHFLKIPAEFIATQSFVFTDRQVA